MAADQCVFCCLPPALSCRWRMTGSREQNAGENEISTAKTLGISYCRGCPAGTRRRRLCGRGLQLLWLFIVGCCALGWRCGLRAFPGNAAAVLLASGYSKRNLAKHFGYLA